MNLKQAKEFEKLLQETEFDYWRLMDKNKGATMNREIIDTKTEQEWLDLRKKDITSTEAGALFGLADSSYIPTVFELWHRKKNHLTSDFEPVDRIRWGQRLQDSIAAGIAIDKGWNIRRITEYIRLADERIGASFDFEITLPDGTRGLLEIKNVDSLIFSQKWVINEDDTVEAPPSIELQLQHQLLVSGHSFGVIGALIGGNRVVLIERKADSEIASQIIERGRLFWASVDADVEPKPDFKRDAESVAKLYGYAEPGKVLTTADEKIIALATKYKEAAAARDVYEADREAAKAELLTLIGDVEKVQAPGFSISCGLIGPCHIEYERSGYRNFKINWPRKKK